MRDDFIVQEVRAALQSMDDVSPEEWFAEMERLGILDKEGNVLRRMPEPPEEPKKVRRPARRRKPRKA